MLLSIKLTAVGGRDLQEGEGCEPDSDDTDILDWVEVRSSYCLHVRASCLCIMVLLLVILAIKPRKTSILRLCICKVCS